MFSVDQGKVGSAGLPEGLMWAGVAARVPSRALRRAEGRQMARSVWTSCEARFSATAFGSSMETGFLLEFWYFKFFFK